METVKVFSEEEKKALVEDVGRLIEKARKLNSDAIEKNPVSKPLPGTEFLHGLLIESSIDTRLYFEMVRLAEDPKMEYTVIL